MNTLLLFASIALNVACLLELFRTQRQITELRKLMEWQVESLEEEFNTTATRLVDRK